jgi:transposase
MTQLGLAPELEWSGVSCSSSSLYVAGNHSSRNIDAEKGVCGEIHKQDN